MSGLIAAGIYPRRERIHVDYTKYLGKDYNYTHDGAGIHVANHITPMDVLIHYVV
jgi:hypothetical protein